MNFISLDSSRREDSNDSKIAFVASILTELFHKMYFYFGIQSSLVSCISIVRGPTLGSEFQFCYRVIVKILSNLIGYFTITRAN